MQVVPRRSIINDAAMNMEVAVPPHSFTSYDLLRSWKIQQARKSEIHLFLV